MRRKSAAGMPTPPDRRWLLALVGFLLLYLGHPPVWDRSLPGLWLAPAGLGVALVAWLGARAALLLAGAGVLAAAQGLLIGPHAPAGSGLAGLAAAADGLVVAGEIWLAWWAYRRAGGARGLGDPPSATLFLLLVPGLVAGLFAPVHAVLLALVRPDDFTGLAALAGACWASHALGILALAPPLLVGLTPWLIRRGLVPPERPGEHRVPQIPTPLAWGDRVELGGLTLATALLGFLLRLAHAQSETMAWLLGGLLLLLAIWASLSQGLRGGSIIAATAVMVALGPPAWLGAGLTPVTPLQGQLLAVCSSALLVGASASWVGAREARHRRLVTRIPVILYSARVLQPGGSGSPPRAAELIFVSPACQSILGCAPEDLLGDYRRWLDQVHPQDRELLVASLAQLCRRQAPVTCEYRLAAASPEAAADVPGPIVVPRAWNGQQAEDLPASAGAVRWVRETLTPRYGARGQLLGWESMVVEITEQRHLAASLRRTTSMFHALVAHLPAGVFFMQGPNGWPIMVNARARELLGHHESAAVDLARLVQFFGLHRPDGTAYPTEELPVSRALRLGLTTMRDDIVVHRPDGRRVPLITWAAPIDLSGHGGTDAAVWVFEDLTALRQAEAAHRESEARLRAVIETMADGLVIYDREAKVVECNPAASAIFGVPPDQMRGRSPLDPTWVHLREDGSRLRGDEHPVVVSLRTGQPVRGVVLGFPEGWASAEGPEGAAGPWPADRLRWILLNAMPLRLRPGHLPVVVVTTFADLTGYRRALEVLRASEEKYRGLVEALPLMVCQADRDLRVTYVNPALETITGYELADLREPSFWQPLLQPDDLQKLLALVPLVLAGQTQQVELRFRAKDGSDKIGHAILQPRRQAGDVVGITTLVVDMTLQRSLEEELERARRLEIVGRLASGIAHDFNNMLTVVLTLTDLAHDALPADHPVREDLRRAAEAGEQAANLAAQLLAFSKQRRLGSGRVDINALTTQTLELLRSTLPANVTVELALSSEDLQVQADETHLQQVLMNLCLNARDAMPDGGRLAVRTEPVRESVAGSGPRWVRLSVEDSGEGMPADAQGRIFAPFFSTKEHGTGLGLAVVQQIVESYGGRIEVHSQPGEGTRFDVWLIEAENEASRGR
jgi:PAS domain S-box-containing protein